MAPPSPGYLLDTNILVHLIRWKTVGQTIDAAFGLLGSLNQSAISVVTVGEMHSLVRKWRWGASKIDQLEKLLDELVWIDINRPDILKTYGELDHLTNRAGCPMGKNDVWLAATAKVSGMKLLTTDGDFDHLHPTHLTRIQIDEKTGNPLP
jgi:predicted nucleic acid-binding protein